MEPKREEIIALLGKKYVMQLILFVREHPGCIKSDAIRAIKGSDRTLFLRIEDLIRVGLFLENDDPRRSNTKKLYLSPEAQELAPLIERMFKLFPEE